MHGQNHIKFVPFHVEGSRRVVTRGQKLRGTACLFQFHITGQTSLRPCNNMPQKPVILMMLSQLHSSNIEVK